MKSVVGLGAGGHAKVVIDILRLSRGVKIVGLLDRQKGLHGKKFAGVAVLGDDHLLSSLRRQGVRYAFLGLGAGGSLGATELRRQLFDQCQNLGFEMVSAIHPKAVIATSAKLGQGVTIMAGAIINPDAVIADNAIVNTGAIVEHDCLIGPHAHVATGVHLAGSVRLGAGAHVGIGASVRQGIEIGTGAVVAAGAVVVKNVLSRQVVAGVPAKVLKKKIS